VKNRTGLLTLFLLISFQLFYCAKIESPPGGPPDVTPPEIIASVPSQSELNVTTQTEIRITFSEKIYKDEVIKNIYIVPEPKTPPRLSWKKSDLVINMREDLHENQTYLITLKSGLQDLRKNKMTKPFRLAFSTGDYLDAGVIEGMVYEDLKPVAGVDVWAFLVDTGFSLQNKSPLYITQTSDSGDYRFEYLADADYYCFAVRDRDADRIYNPLKDMIGIPVSPVVLDSSIRYHSGFDFHLFADDTTSLKLVAVEFISNLMISIKLSSGVFAPELTPDNFVVTSDTDSLPLIISYLIYFRDSTDNVLLVPEKIPSIGIYSLQIKDFTNINDKPIGIGMDTISFNVEIISDTIAPNLVSSCPEDDEKSFITQESMEFIFNELIQINSADTTILYLMSEDSVYNYNLNLIVENNRIKAISLDSLKPGTNYTLYLDLSKIRDRFDNKMGNDSIKMIKFLTENRNEFGAILGRLQLSTGTSIDDIIVFVSSLDKKLMRRVDFGDTLQFKLDLPAGKYFFYAFEDRNQNSNYDRGKIPPLRYSEKRYIIKGEYSVRSRFETEDVVLELK
jgi:Bacterial Ig-like domain